MRAMILVALLSPMPAMAFTAQNGMSVRQTGPAEMMVAPAPRRDETDYWCAAGDFARRALGMPGKARLWRASPKPRKAGEGIAFTLTPDHKADDAGLSQFGAGPRDGSITVAMATGNFCRPARPFWRD